MTPNTASHPARLIGARTLAYAVGAALGYAADHVFGDPRRAHPVAAFGRAAAALESRLWRDNRAAGALHTALCVGTTVATAALATAATRRETGPGWGQGPGARRSLGRRTAVARGPGAGRSPEAGKDVAPSGPRGGSPEGRAGAAPRPGSGRSPEGVRGAAPAGPRGRSPRVPGRGGVGEHLPPVLLAALVSWAVLGGASLRREALGIAHALRAHDLDDARRRLPRLCGRDPHHLGEADIARAVVESVAENTSDAVVGALVWGAAGGVPGLAGFRAVNTLDAMVGHKSARHLRFGWAAARLDDLAGYPGARLTAALAALDRKSVV